MPQSKCTFVQIQLYKENWSLFRSKGVVFVVFFPPLCTPVVPVLSFSNWLCVLWGFFSVFIWSGFVMNAFSNRTIWCCTNLTYEYRLYLQKLFCNSQVCHWSTVSEATFFPLLTVFSSNPTLIFVQDLIIQEAKDLREIQSIFSFYWSGTGFFHFIVRG